MISDEELEKRLRETPSKLDDLELSEEYGEIIEKINKQTRYTRIRKKILLTQIPCFIALIFLVPASSFGMLQISHIIYEKLQNAGIQEEEMKQIGIELAQDLYTEDRLSEMTELKKNENGLTYGPEAFGADLILVISEEGYEGYVYRTDLYAAKERTLSSSDIDEEVQESNYIPVYESDGITKIGTFYIKHESD